MPNELPGLTAANDALALEANTHGNTPPNMNPTANFNSAATSDFNRITNEVGTLKTALQSSLTASEYSVAQPALDAALALPATSKAMTPGAGSGQHIIFNGSGANDTLNLGSGTTAGGWNILDGQSGSDTLYGTHNDLLIGGSSNDSITASGGYNVIFGDSGTDTIVAAGSHNVILGGDSGDYINVSASSGYNVIDGGSGGDIVFLSSNDVARLGSGDDEVHMTGGGNIVSGGSGGNNKYYLAENFLPTLANRITDFTNNNLYISKVAGINSFSDLTITQVGSDTLVKYGSQEIVILEGVSASSVTASDFIITPGGPANTDTTPPSISAQLSNDTGHSATDKITTNASVTGTVTDASTITAFKAGFDSTPTANYVDVLSTLVNGNFSFNQTQINNIYGGSLTAGTHTLKLFATDSSNNTSSIYSLQFTFVIDNTAPALTAALANDNGASSTDLKTTDPTISGTVSDANQVSELKASLNNSNAASYVNVTNLISGGTFTFNQATMVQLNGGNALTPGTQVLRLQATDEFGNVSGVTTFTFNYVIDTTAPNVSVALANDNGASNSDLKTTDSTISGTVTDANTVTNLKASLNNSAPGSYVDITNLINASNGNFVISPSTMQTLNGGNALTQGQQTLRLIATDEFGNISGVTTFTFNYVIDATPPSINVALANDNGVANDLKTTDPTVNGQITDANTVTNLKASLNNSAPGSYVDITNLVNGSGNFTLNASTLQQLNGGSPLSPGTQVLRLFGTDEFGNVSGITTFTYNYVVDNDGPSISVAVSNDNGASANDNKTSVASVSGQVTDQNAIFSLKASVNSSNPLSLQEIGNLLDSSGNFVLNQATLESLNGNNPLNQGANTVRLVARDEFGNESSVTTFTFYLDNTGPDLDVALVNDTGTPSDGITADPTISGSVTDQSAFGALYASVNDANPLALVDVSSQVNTGDGSFTLSRSLLETIYGGSLPGGNIDVRLKATDEFGNVTLRTFSFTYVVDETPPLLTAALQHDTGRSGTDNVSVDPTIAGTVSDETQFAQLLAGVDSMTPGNYVDVTAHVDSNGNYVLDQDTLETVLGADLSRGVHTIHLLAKDAAGNETATDFSFNFNRPFAIFPGDRLNLDLKDYFQGSDNSTLFTVLTSDPLPTGHLKLNGQLEFVPSIDEYGRYEFVISARTGNDVVTQEFAIDVLHDPVTTTRISGRLIDLDWEPIEGVDVEFNGEHTFSDEEGRFTLTVTQPITTDVIIFHELTEIEEDGELEIYAYLAQKIHVLLGHPVWEGVNNIISRHEYLPELDVENGETIDPNLDYALTTPEIPGVSLNFGNHTLLDTDGSYYTGLLTITEMPVDQMPISRPPNNFPDLVIAIQPERLTFTTPAQLTMPDRTGYKVGTVFDLYAIDPILGDFQIVGEAVKSSDGLIHTTSGGISTTDWAYVTPRPTQSGAGTDPSQCLRAGDPLCSCQQCGAQQKGASGAISSTGEFLEDHQLAGYQSLGEYRGLTLTYDSVRANPEQLFRIPFENALFGPVLSDPRTRFVAQMWIEDGNFRQDLPGFINADGDDTGLHFWKYSTSAGDAVAKIDMRDFASGYYDIGVRDGFMITGQDGSINGTMQSFNSKILNINYVDSIFGAGWGLNGLKQIVENGDGSILIIDGNGTQQLLNAPLTSGGAYIGSEGDFSTMIKRPDGTFLRTMPDQTEYSYNEFNMLESIVDSNGNTTSYQYDPTGKLIGMTDPAGLITVFNYTGGRISEIVDPFGRITALIHDADGNLTGITDPDGETTQYSYDDKRLLTGTIDKRDFTTQVFYDAAGRADKEILKDGGIVDFDALRSQGYVDYESTKDPNNAPTIGLLFTGLIQVDGEDNLRIVNYKDARGNTISTALDDEGHYSASRDLSTPPFGVVNAVVRTNDLITRTIDGRGNATDYTYDAHGNVTSISDSLSASAGTFIDYLDVTGYGNLVSGISNTNQPSSSLVTLPFDFEFYGQDYSQIGISNNGLISFGGINSNFNNIDLTQPGAAAALANLPSLLPFWDGFETSNNNSYTSRVSTATIGEDGARKFIIQWQQVVSAGNIFEQVLYDYEVELHEGTNKVLFNYKSTNGDGAHARGRDATVGIWNSATEYQQFSFNQLSLFDGQSYVVSQTGFAAQTAPTGTGSKVFTYDPVFNQVTSITDELGHKTLFDIDPTNGNVLKMTRVVGAVGGNDDVITEYSYNSHGQLTQVLDAEGRITEYTYNSIGRVTLVTEAKNTADERTTGYEYDLYGNVSAIIDPKNNRTEYEYDAMNRLTVLRRSDPDGLGPLESPETFFVYDDEGNLENYTDAEGRQTFFQYDEVGRMIEITDPLNHHRNYEYDFNGNLTKITDELGRETQQFYDARNRLFKVIEPNGQEIQYIYDSNDNLTSVFRPGIFQEFYTYDSRNRLISTTNIGGDQRTFHYTYDAADNLIRSREDRGFNGIEQDTHYYYDDLDRLTLLTNQNRAFTTFKYDKLGNQLSRTDAVGNVTQSLYDFLNRLTTMIDSAGGITSYEYDANDNLTSMTDAVNNTTSYGYDALNRQVSMTDARNMTSTMKYDAVDNLIESTDRDGRTRAFTFDDLDRLIQEDWLLNGTWTGTRFTYDYDDAGNMTEAEDNASHLTMQYGNMNQLTQVDNAGTPGAPHVVIDYTYDNAVRVTSVKDTIEGVVGATDTFTWNNGDNQLRSITQTGTGVTTKIRDYSYDFFGRMTGFVDYKDTRSFANQVALGSFGYDTLGRVTQSSTFFRLNGGGGAGHSYQYRYDSIDRMTMLQENLGFPLFTSNTQRFTYDDAGRLTTTDNSLGSRPDEGYTYDDNGNRLSDATHGTNLVYGDGNRLLSDGTYNYDYDDEGNLIRRTTIASGSYREMAFDFRNRLVMVTERNSSDVATQVTTYQYDCFDRRISKQVDSNPADGIEAPITWFAYDGANVRLEFVDVDGSGAVPAVLTTRYFNGLGVDNVIAQENYAGSAFDTGAFWLIKNYQGSTTDIVKAADEGGFQNHITYDSYGNVLSQTNANAGSRYLYTGREYDAETGLQYYRARYYDSTLGRFLSEDGLPSTNLFTYVGNNPVNFTDPSGLKGQYIAMEPKYDFSNTPQLPAFKLSASSKALPELNAMGRPHYWSRNTMDKQLGILRRSGKLRRDEQDQLDRGCVGLTSLYAGRRGGDFLEHPEDAPGTKAFMTEGAARDRAVPKGSTNFVFAKEGFWSAPHKAGSGFVTTGSAPTPGPNGQVPVNSISNAGGHYNYIVTFPDTGTYAWADTGASMPQTYMISPKPPAVGSFYPYRVWFSTPVRN